MIKTKSASTIGSITLNLRLFLQGALLSYVALFRWLRPTTYLASKIVMPLGQILFFTFLGSFASGGKNTSFYVIGNAVQLAALSGVFGVTMSITGDRWEGTLPYLFGTPANRLAMFIGRALIHVFDGMIGVVVGLTWGVLLLNLDLTKADPAALAIVILITAFSTCGLGLMLGSLSLVTRNVMFVNNTVYFLLLILSGSNVVLSNLPGWMQVISNLIPLTRGIASARLIIAGGDLSEISGLIGVELLIGVGYILVGYILFRWFETQAKRRGTLDIF